MKKLTKRGFTIVELVIVMAVIAILAAVMIPTFSGVIDKANDSAFRQAARNDLVAYIGVDKDAIEGDFLYIDGERYAVIKDGNFVLEGDEIKIFETETDALDEFKTTTTGEGGATVTTEYVKDAEVENATNLWSIKVKPANS
jgi:prepilin-type N-terminal cleavage/methylation domain-containing protein